MILIRLLRNPFYVYILSFILVFLLYSLGWSSLYPPLSFDLYIFFVFTFIIALILGHVFNKNRYIGFKRLDKNHDLQALFFLIVIWIGHSIEFAYFKTIPLISLLSGNPTIDYKEYGIKTFHVILVSFNSFAIVYLFHYYISNKKRKILFYFLLALLPSILIINRGMFLIGTISSLFVYLFSLKKFINPKQLTLILLGTLAILYLFGFVGNLRSGNGDPSYIPNESKATKVFMNSKIPKEYYWTYLYGASPLANFQNNINKTEKVNYNILDLVIFELFPDVISKRIGVILDREKLNQHQITHWLTVGSVYSRSYSYAKWLGPPIIFFYLIFIIILSIGIVNKSSKYHVSIVAILLTLVFMNTFDNMLVFAGIFLQLFYPILFSLFERFSYGK